MDIKRLTGWIMGRKVMARNSRPVPYADDHLAAYGHQAKAHLVELGNRQWDRGIFHRQSVDLVQALSRASRLEQPKEFTLHASTRDTLIGRDDDLKDLVWTVLNCGVARCSMASRNVASPRIRIVKRRRQCPG
jgi:hypothetical protein